MGGGIFVRSVANGISDYSYRCRPLQGMRILFLMNPVIVLFYERLATRMASNGIVGI